MPHQYAIQAPTSRRHTALGRALSPAVLREYALLADGHRGALVGPDGDVAWLCAPGWSDPAVFSSLLGGPGRFLVAPAGRHVWGGHYEAGSLIWRSRWVTGDGIVESREALVFPGEADRLVLLRQIHALKGRPGCGWCWTRGPTSAGNRSRASPATRSGGWPAPEGCSCGCTAVNGCAGTGRVSSSAS